MDPLQQSLDFGVLLHEIDRERIAVSGDKAAAGLRGGDRFQ
jgi:hypothetical protein